MKKYINQITIIQWLTIGSIVLYLLWEYYFLADWKAETSGPLIRVDLLLIYPLILVGIIISLWQLLKRKNKR